MAGIDNLKPFPKGVSGNPAGYPKGIPNSKTRYLRLLTLTEQIKNPVTGELEQFSIMEQLDMQLIAKARKGDISAYKEIMDRLEGKPVQNVDMSVTGKASTEEKIKEFLDEPANDTGNQLAAADRGEFRGEVADAPTDIS